MLDIHPLVIHYPIAFLTTFAVLELLRFRKLLGLPYWFYIKAALLTVGEISAIVTVVAAFMSNALASDIRLVEMYKLFIAITALIFGLISLIYLKWPKILRPEIIIPLTLIGLFFIIVAGGLFGATVYGTQFDPFLAPVFKLLDVY